MIATAIYNAGIRLYKTGVQLAALGGNAKAARWLKGRHHWQKQLQEWQLAGQPLVWMHAASLGEFEQGRPVLEAIRQQFPENKILLTFFSPSGYEVRKNYPGADYICYLPLDTAANARRFLELVQPQLAIFVKYEFWYHYLTELHIRKVPTLLISGIFRPEQPFFKSYGAMFRRLLQQFNHIFVQNEASLQLLQGLHLQQVSLGGDTRFDRVSALLQDQRALPLIEQFLAGKRLLAAGSTWPSDEKMLAAWWKEQPDKDLKLILAPHEIGESHIQSILQLFPDALRYSQLTGHIPESNVLIIDNIGMLTALYRYATICYVGGGLDKGGIHNILEPAVYSKPVIMGPVFDRYFEAVELEAAGGALVVRNHEELLARTTLLLHNTAAYNQIAAIAGNYVQSNRGATEKVISYIQEKRFLNRE
ncbi:3-deoxy-D-manno-octulosonic acid transferase [Chitinophaga vietnamensis]|uniref:3-deoxy-D-manno-octulosonic acid transferase n=1 Tax=Chitinophaga vietnamensis TaxID=2593957 RepID=UPI001F3928AF|nr:glycosyltransferase N-terminal domain-containing protein [Chitinophaga vietnamensis]